VIEISRRPSFIPLGQSSPVELQVQPSTNVVSRQEFPVMQFTREEMDKGIKEYQNAPRTGATDSLAAKVKDARFAKARGIPSREIHLPRWFEEPPASFEDKPEEVEPFPNAKSGDKPKYVAPFPSLGRANSTVLFPSMINLNGSKYSLPYFKGTRKVSVTGLKW